MGYFVYQYFSIVIYEYILISKSRKSQHSSDVLTTIFYYLSRIVVNITDFPAPFKMLKKIKISGRNY